jgi:16S rRNA (uracil1498-N3)-methyltransferase
VPRPQPAEPPDPLLRQAAALVYVADLESPELTKADAHHLLGPLRLRPGELIAVADGNGGYRGCRLAAGARRGGGPGRSARAGRDSEEDGGVPLELATPIRMVERAVPAVTVGVSLAKGDRTQWAVAKLVEVGVDRIIPLVCDRTVVRPGGGRPERLGHIAREAAMQARRLYLPEVRQPCALQAVINELAGDGGVALAEPGGDPPSLEPPAVLIGPEGGWSAAESSMPLGRVGLGQTVLRIETAAVVAGALLVAMRAGLVRPPGPRQ